MKFKCFIKLVVIRPVRITPSKRKRKKKWTYGYATDDKRPYPGRVDAKRYARGRLAGSGERAKKTRRAVRHGRRDEQNCRETVDRGKNKKFQKKNKKNEPCFIIIATVIIATARRLYERAAD